VARHHPAALGISLVCTLPAVSDVLHTRVTALPQMLVKAPRTDTPWCWCRWRPRDLGDLLSAVLGQEGAWDRKDADILLSVTRLLEDGFARCTPRRSYSIDSFQPSKLQILSFFMMPLILCEALGS